MRQLTLLFFLLGATLPLCAQLQTADSEGASQAAALKKLNKKAKYGAYLIQKEVNFASGKGITGSPVVTAYEKGLVEMASIENKAFVGYVLPYNQFVKLTMHTYRPASGSRHIFLSSRCNLSRLSPGAANNKVLPMTKVPV